APGAIATNRCFDAQRRGGRGGGRRGCRLRGIRTGLAAAFESRLRPRTRRWGAPPPGPRRGRGGALPPPRGAPRAGDGGRGAPRGPAAARGGIGPAGVAVIGAVFGADEPVDAALALARAVRRALAPR